MMLFALITPEIQLGTLISAASTVSAIVYAAVRLGRQVGKLESTVDKHADMLREHADLFKKSDERSFRLVEHVQRMMGNMEMMQVMERRADEHNKR